MGIIKTCKSEWSLPSWERGLKYHPRMWQTDQRQVAPFVGAWIEMRWSGFSEKKIEVAPFVGAWIEILLIRASSEGKAVAPFVGAWIEIPRTDDTPNVIKSLPSWERGLKYLN